jgi:hypothetical protein
MVQDTKTLASEIKEWHERSPRQVYSLLGVLFVMMTVGVIALAQYSYARPPGPMSPLVFMVSPSEGAGATISGAYTFEATVENGPADGGVNFYVTPNIMGGEATIIPATYDSGSGIWHAVSYDTTGFSDGSYTVFARGTVSSVPYDSSWVTFSIDNSGGGGGGGGGGPTPTVTMTSPVDGACVSGTFNLVASVANGTATQVQVMFNGSVVPASYSPNGDGTWTFSLPSEGFLPDGTYPFGARATVSAQTYDATPISLTLDNTTDCPGGGGGGGGETPVVTISSPDGSNVSGTFPLSVVVQNGPASDVQILLNGNPSPLHLTDSDEDGTWTGDVDSVAAHLSDTSYGFAARATVGEQTYDSNEIILTIDNSGGGGGGGPVGGGGEETNSLVVITQPTDSQEIDPIQSRVNLSVDVHVASASNVSFYLDGGLSPIQAQLNSGATWNASIAMTSLSIGEHTLIARAVSATGTTSSDPVTFTISDLQVPRIATPQLCVVLNGSVHITGTTLKPAEVVQFSVKEYGEIEDVYTSSGSYNNLTGIWDGGTWDTSEVSAGDYVIFMTADGRTTTQSVGVHQSPTVLPECVYPATVQSAMSVSTVTPHNLDIVSGNVPLTLYTSPEASSAFFEVYQEGAGVPENITLTKSGSEWNGMWDTTHLKETWFTIRGTALANNGAAFSSNPINVTVRMGTSTTDTATTTGDVPKSSTSTNPLFDSSVTGTYSAMQASAANPTIDIGLNIQKVTGPTLCTPGSLIKLEDDHNADTTFDTSVYYCAQDGKRYAFPNDRIFFSWFEDFSSVKTVPSSIMFNIPLGGNVSYRPGTRMIKIQTDPKVYAVTRGGILRWITSEAVAKKVYGEDWNTLIDDVSDAFFVNYTIGLPITE